MKFPNTLHVEVTREDISKGIPRNSHYCPIALAVSRQFPQCETAVTSTKIEILCKEDGSFTTGIYDTPVEAYRFVSRFDHQILKETDEMYDSELDKEYRELIQPLTFDATAIPREW